MGCEGNVLNSIGIMGTLLANFPKGIWDTIKNNQKNYNDIFAFIDDLMNALGLRPIEIIPWLIGQFGGISDKVELSIEKIKDWADNVDSSYQSSWLMDFENGVKYAIATALASIPSCSANLIIGDDYFDGHNSFVNDNPGTSFNIEGGVVIPLSDIDPFNYLKFCPIGRIGNGYYSINKEKIKKVSDLYRADDMNAFLWYCKNRSSITPQKEVNKTMWDNRVSRKRNNNFEEVRDTDEKWEEWLNSKTEKWYYDKNENSKLTLKSSKKLKPILQIKRYGTTEPAILVQIASQNYYRSRKIAKVGNYAELSINKTLIEFNMDYLTNIQIFSLKSIITSVIDGFLNGSYYNSLELSIKAALPEKMIRKIIKQTIQTETSETNINDCFFSFSNDEFNKMMEDIELMRYKAKSLNNATNDYSQSSDESLLNLKESILNDNENTGTLNEENRKITETLEGLTIYSRNVETTGGLSITASESWLYEFFDELIMQLITPIISPKVFLLFVLNYKILGYDTIGSWEELWKLFLNVLVSVIKYIIWALIKLLLELILKVLSNKITAYIIIRTTEMIVKYLELLAQAITRCIPGFDLSNLNNFLGYDNKGLDDVTGADIIPEKTTPDSTTGC